MTDLNVNAARPNLVSSDTVGTNSRSAPLTPAATQATTPSDNPAPPPTDSVTLTLGAKSTTPNSTSTSDLTDAQATDASVTLRQQLTKNGLSATAQQNQAILSLLR